MAKNKEAQKAQKLDVASLLKVSESIVSELKEKEVFFFDGDKEYSSIVWVKSLSYDEVVNLMRGKDPQKVLMADLAKARVVASIFDKETGRPLFTDKNIGSAAPQIIDALHKASDEVNDFTGKYLLEKLTKKNSGANSSSTELAEEQSQKQSEE